jgi:hypothetical protein
MILVQTNKNGETIELANGPHGVVLDKLNKTIEYLESNGVFLIKEKNNCYEFANEMGWYCVLMFADGYIKNIKTKIK